jgi:hypothetical protein
MEKFQQKVEIQKSSDFGGFQSPEMRGEKKGENHQIPMFGFQCVAKIVEE